LGEIGFLLLLGFFHGRSAKIVTVEST
jgi:hypothetical protein